MLRTRRVVWYAVLLLVGAAMLIAGVLEYADSFVAGMGGAFAAVAVIRLVGEVRYARDASYAKRVDVSNTDERNVYLATTAASWAFRVSVLGLALASLVVRFCGYPSAASVLAEVVAAETLTYFVTYLVVSRTN